ncbi:hypothetical protein CEP54_015294 [Fusarium duplospermum]|uniref:Uncharacterized protein n=1 Tax=Fusarium duplospermum TaxID=1325734 RepID=A0A428NQ59_9HYPO|nr:hypothetical protein CEP54_015294 [Fusarium duplospermum]
MGARQGRPRRTPQEQFRSENAFSTQEDPGDPITEGQHRSKEPQWVGQLMRKTGVTLINKSFKFGRDCDTKAAVLFYNKAHKLWYGSVYPHNAVWTDDANEIIQRIQSRQIVDDNGNLVRLTAKQRKQAAKGPPHRVQKQTTERNLRPRNPQARVHPEPHASPALTQITVAESESAPRREDASIWSIPPSPELTVTRRVRNPRTSAHGAPEDNSGGEENHTGYQLYRSQAQSSPASTNDHDAEGEPCEAAGDIAGPVQGHTDRSTPHGAATERVTAHNFGSTLPDDVLIGDMAADAGMGISMDMDMGMDMDMDMADFDMGYFNNIGFDAGLNMEVLSNVTGLQCPSSSRSPRAPFAALSPTTATTPATSHRPTSKARPIDAAAAPHASASSPVPEPDHITHQVNIGVSPQVPGSARAQPGSTIEAGGASRQVQPANPPGEGSACNWDDFIELWKGLMVNTLAKRKQNATVRRQHDARRAQLSGRLSTGLVA